ncbi:SDR family NAD(P)-dependent oxidoreductase [Zavarzinia compransoris]|uniref:SDR family NAD(P)-dependent oxidoreductase n=1 Tax=Zavarzinia marina TaxID=2911065 RepID=UPI001F1786C5|nr:SDR family NAD(P)-dependent oxidoreductase [Zavarzinia marina]MCF4167688.1 SDR family NAD(P)-dependent oxidoreductase [Zavarzinia marina]
MTGNELEGRIALVTGANRGIGLETAKGLVARGAEVVIACRDESRAAETLDRLRAVRPGATVRAALLSLDDLASVRDCVATVSDSLPGLDILVCNAGVFGVEHGHTAQGFEWHFGANCLGHFALTLGLLPLMAGRRDARVVTVTSAMYRRGRIDFEDLDWRARRYNKWQAYADSKLGNLLLAEELQRRLDQAGIGVKSLLSHPGYAATNSAWGGRSIKPTLMETAMLALGNALMAQSPAMGAAPSLLAATDPAARGGDLYGPSKLGGMRGAPAKADKKITPDPATAARLFDLALARTGTRWDFRDAA